MPSSSYPLAVICCHPAKLFPQLIYSFSGWLLHHPYPCQTDRRAWEIHRNDSRGTDSHRLKWHTQNGVAAAFIGIWDNRGMLQAKKKSDSNIQISVTWDVMLDVCHPSSSIYCFAHLEMCLDSACPRGQKTLSFYCKQLCLHLLSSATSV